MARRTQSNQILRLVILWGEVGVVYRKGRHCPLGTIEGWRFFPWTQTQPVAMLTTPACCFFHNGGDLVPVFRVALAVYGHDLSLEKRKRVAVFDCLYYIMT